MRLERSQNRLKDFANGCDSRSGLERVRTKARRFGGARARQSSAKACEKSKAKTLSNLGAAGCFIFCFLNNLSGLRIVTTFYLAKNDHQWVSFIYLER